MPNAKRPNVSQKSQQRKAETMKTIKATSAELAIIQACGRAATAQTGHGLRRMEIGVRYAFSPAEFEPSMNIFQIDKTRHWEASDLYTTEPWKAIRKGIPAGEDGRAILDFYCYSAEGLETNCQAVFEAGRLVWCGTLGGGEFGFTHWGALPAFALAGGSV